MDPEILQRRAKPIFLLKLSKTPAIMREKGGYP
jgi:hypothetical protein